MQCSEGGLENAEGKGAGSVADEQDGGVSGPRGFQNVDRSVV